MKTMRMLKVWKSVIMIACVALCGCIEDADDPYDDVVGDNEEHLGEVHMTTPDGLTPMHGITLQIPAGENEIVVTLANKEKYDTSFFVDILDLGGDMKCELIEGFPPSAPVYEDVLVFRYNNSGAPRYERRSVARFKVSLPAGAAYSADNVAKLRVKKMGIFSMIYSEFTVVQAAD